MSLSINTNTSSMVALETLNATQTALSATENAVSTGKKVASAEDSPAAYGIAAQMQGDISGQSAVNDGLTFAAKVIGTASSAADKILSVLSNVQNAVTTIGNNQTSGTSLSQINAELTGYFNQIDAIAGGATTNGVNLFANAVSSTTVYGSGVTGSDLAFVTGLNGQTSKATSYAGMSGLLTTGTPPAGGATPKPTDATPQTTDATPQTTGTTFSAMLGLSAAHFIGGTGAASTMVGSDLGALIKDVQDAIINVTKFTSNLGASSKTIASLSAFGTTLSDNLTAGVGALTDADMSAESAKLTSLQTKQSLAIKSLTIANGQSQNILSLFQG